MDIVLYVGSSVGVADVVTSFTILSVVGIAICDKVGFDAASVRIP